MKQIIDFCPSDDQLQFSTTGRSYYEDSDVVAAIKDKEMNKKTLAIVYYHLKRNLRSLFNARNQWDEIVESAGELEDMIARQVYFLKIFFLEHYFYLFVYLFFQTNFLNIRRVAEIIREI